jgi:hypothetical protein
MTNIIEQNELRGKLEYISDNDEWIDQYTSVVYGNFPAQRNVLLEGINKTIDLLFSDEHIKLCINKNKAQDIKINNMEKEIIQKDIEIKELKSDVTELKKKNTEYERNDKLIYVIQACLNMQMYIVKKVTGWNKREYRKNYEQECGNNYNEFKEYYLEYYERAIELEKELQIDDLLPTIKKLKDDRNLISHPNKIDIEKLNTYCEEICSKYHGITKVGKNYYKIDVSLFD